MGVDQVQVAVALGAAPGESVNVVGAFCEEMSTPHSPVLPQTIEPVGKTAIGPVTGTRLPIGRLSQTRCVNELTALTNALSCPGSTQSLADVVTVGATAPLVNDWTFSVRSLPAPILPPRLEREFATSEIAPFAEITPAAPGCCEVVVS